MKQLILTNDEIGWLAKHVDGFEKTSVVIFPDERSLNRFIKSKNLSEDELVFPSHDVFPFEEIGISERVRRYRMETLNNIVYGNARVIYTSLHGLFRKTIPRKSFESQSIFLEKSGTLNLVPERFTEIGYERVFTVSEPGMFSIKGEIFDIFVPGNKFPFRVDIFDKNIESLKVFDPQNQRSLEMRNRAIITPASEAIFRNSNISRLVERVKKIEERTGSKLPYELDDQKLFETVSGIFYKNQSYLLDYLNDEKLYLINPDEAFDEFQRVEREVQEYLEENSTASVLYKRYSGVSPENLFAYNNYCIVSSEEPEYLTWDIQEKEKVKTEKIKKTKEKEQIPRIPIVDWTELDVNDYVVHREYGIGRFLGVKRITNLLGTREYLTLEYKNNTKIYVPVERVDRVHKYVGPEEGVQLNSLSGNLWTRQKKKVEKDLKKKIKELATLYARRERVKGCQLNGDPELEKAFEDSFPHVETEDQINAINEVLEDLSDEMPMDRLVSGDAGFGKTEIALRAAFRSVISGKQAAILVPTTVLATQHFETFKERMEPFGIKVDILDRYRTAKEKELVIDGIKKGNIDILIGTHSLLSPKLSFADLGLVIIDEEQLFGVMQKEYFKKLRLSVNIQSMSATPIPRTLYMALSGLRELSVISTPPYGRREVETYVGQFKSRLVRTAVLREINRGGQIIYVHNRVEELDEREKVLKELVPEAKIGVAHGKMPKKLFEENVKAFYNGDIDLLLCTTIIESGVDIPNANTLIVDDSQRYGLAQLYQLRGRVGRSDRRAFSYFFYDKKSMTPQARKRLKAINEYTGAGSGMKLSMKDMEIRGFGALLGDEQHGNISTVGLYMYNEMLQKAVAEMKGKEEKKKESERVIDTELRNIPYHMVIPEDYISNSIERLKIYRRIATAENVDVIDNIENELIDRFGTLPEHTKSLLRASRIRIGAYNKGVSIIDYDSESQMLNIYFKEGKIDRRLFSRFKAIVNENESRVFVYSVYRNRVMNTLERMFVGEGK
ncbi:MAG: transcription-repair coupling factor [Kosmotoga sp.]|nr:MAG: transcription-repair coupling factor [Kosmotoga sp.]